VPPPLLLGALGAPRLRLGVSGSRPRRSRASEAALVLPRAPWPILLGSSNSLRRSRSAAVGALAAARNRRPLGALGLHLHLPSVSNLPQRDWVSRRLLVSLLLVLPRPQRASALLRRFPVDSASQRSSLEWGASEEEEGWAVAL